MNNPKAAGFGKPMVSWGLSLTRWPRFRGFRGRSRVTYNRSLFGISSRTSGACKEEVRREGLMVYGTAVRYIDAERTR